MDPSLAAATPRQRECHAAVRRLLGAAIALTGGLAFAERSGAPTETGPAGGPSRPLVSLPVDLSRDPSWLLRSLAGVGPARARAILEDRARNGPLPSVEALDRIAGFGPKTAAALRADGAVASGARGGGTARKAPGDD